ncbi:MAG: bifunctional UDP-N-acetylglucosamine diphosphorylase/glucosamine-1-phosphate N-acetyltransferase GlmU, partial [Clostridiales bacterium]|nr:bifunctional UDP-N-acetylglucosamine diphosphorylase/glucosamine-1-phosphate N-acetyltransferase GlmU [Clostridiales bacterium]
QQSNIQTFHPSDLSELLVVNNRVNLATAEARMRLRINENHMTNGITFLDPNQTYIGADVRIGRDTLIYPGNILEGNTIIGEGCILYQNNRLKNAVISDQVTIQSSVILDSTVGQDSTVGPFAYIRPDSTIGSNVRIGDFVEVKKSIIGNGSKVSHLTYIGDAQVGEDVNVGCGVVFVNYDGKQKQQVTVGDNAFIGCNVNLVAPVKVENNAYVAAGSTITENVPEKALAIARARQTIKDGWVDKKEQK